MQRAKRLFLVLIVISLMAVTGCTSALTPGNRIDDGSHTFILHSAQIIDKTEDDTAPEGDSYLILEYEAENLLTRSDSERQWTDQMSLSAGEDVYEAVRLDSLDTQLWQTSLSPGEARSGYVAYIVPDDIDDFELAVTLPISGNEETYSLRPADRRIGNNTDLALTRLEQIERTKRIPVIGGLLEMLSRAPVRHQGTLLIPESEIPQLLEDIHGLPEEARQSLVEEYLLNRGHGRLE